MIGQHALSEARKFNEITKQDNDLTALDDFYRRLVEMRIKDPSLLHPGASESPQEQYAYLMHTFVESVMDRARNNEKRNEMELGREVRGTWGPLVKAELARYRWFVERNDPGGWGFKHDAWEFFMRGGFRS